MFVFTFGLLLFNLLSLHCYFSSSYSLDSKVTVTGENHLVALGGGGQLRA